MYKMEDTVEMNRIEELKLQRNEYATQYRLLNKGKISERNRVYFEKMKSNVEFMARRKASINTSILNRRLENKKENPKPIRGYVKYQNPTSLGDVENPTKLI